MLTLANRSNGLQIMHLVLRACFMLLLIWNVTIDFATFSLKQINRPIFRLVFFSWQKLKRSKSSRIKHAEPIRLKKIGSCSCNCNRKGLILCSSFFFIFWHFNLTIPELENLWSLEVGSSQGLTLYTVYLYTHHVLDVLFTFLIFILASPSVWTDSSDPVQLFIHGWEVIHVINFKYVRIRILTMKKNEMFKVWVFSLKIF